MQIHKEREIDLSDIHELLDGFVVVTAVLAVVLQNEILHKMAFIRARTHKSLHKMTFTQNARSNKVNDWPYN